MRVSRPAFLILLLAVAALLSLGCGGADGRKSSKTQVIPGSSGCRTPATPLPLRGTTLADAGLLVGTHAGLRFFDGNGLCRVARTARDVGAGAVREDFGWKTIEPRRGAYDWTIPDRLATTAAQWGFVLVPILGNETPAWARGSRARSYATFVAAVVKRYAPDGTFWASRPALKPYAPVWFELWNEPYERTNPARLTVRAYASLVQEAVPAGRAASKAAKYLVAGEYTYRRENGSFGNWTRELYALVPDLATQADGITVHAYGLKPPSRFDPADGAGQVARVEAIRADLVERGAANLPLWITEAGWSSCTDRSVCVSAADAARNLTRLFAAARGPWREYVRALLVYNLQDLPGADLADKECCFGLIRVNGKAKPARAAFKRGAAGR